MKKTIMATLLVFGFLYCQSSYGMHNGQGYMAFKTHLHTRLSTRTYPKNSHFVLISHKHQTSQPKENVKKTFSSKKKKR